jgi:hypothetical protein
MTGILCDCPVTGSPVTISNIKIPGLSRFTSKSIVSPGPKTTRAGRGAR